MNSTTGAYCPEWCTANHSPQDLTNDDLVVHSRGFGNFNDGQVALVQVWAINCGENIETTGVTVPIEDMRSPEDLKRLAYNYLWAADWMEENLAPDFFSHQLTAQQVDHSAV